MYACCKHGAKHRMRHCGYAHTLGEVAPPQCVQRKFWVDTMHLYRGHSGIDMFIGQDYSPLQLERILTLAMNEDFHGLPAWSRQLLWFLGLRSADSFVCDGDWQYFDRLRDILPGCMLPTSNFGLLLSDGISTPFEWLVDSEGRTLLQRMRVRIRSRSEFNVFRSAVEWYASAEWADSTPMLWGAHSRQYLSITARQQYVVLGQDDADDPWWFVVAVDCVGEYLARGGWAPPTAFGVVVDTIVLYEVVFPEFARQSAEYVRPQRPIFGLGEARIHTDGSTNDREGIAGSWIFQGIRCSGIASLACRCGGSEASELLGIAGGLAACLCIRRHFREFHFLSDSRNAILHVWHRQDPGSPGRHLIPGILLCRRLIDALLYLDVRVRFTWVPRTENPAHYTCKAEQVRRRRHGWRRCDDVWPEGLPSAFQSVFTDIGHNFVSGGSPRSLRHEAEEALHALYLEALA